MVSTDAQAYLAVDLESAARGGETEAGRTERVGGWQHDAAVVDAFGVGRIGRSSEGEVPLEEVRF